MNLGSCVADTHLVTLGLITVARKKLLTKRSFLLFLSAVYYRYMSRIPLYKKPLIVDIFISAILVAVLHKLALEYHLYWNIWWFDIGMHFLGGLVIGLLAFFIVKILNVFNFTTAKPLIYLAMTIRTVIIVGLLWEVWELWNGFTSLPEDAGDMLLDLIMDVVGGLTAYWYGVWRLSRLRRKEL